MARKATRHRLSKGAMAPDKLGDLALHLSESRYRRLFETAQDGILLLNADTAQIEDVNPYLIRMLDYSHEEFLGKKLWEVGAFADIAESKEMFAELQTTGYVRFENLPLRAKAGHRVEVEFISNSYDCEGVKVIQCNIRNISDRVKARRAQEAAEGNLRAVVEQMITGIYMVQDGKFAFVNRRGAEILGETSASGVVGTNPLDWVVESDRAAIAEMMRRLTAGEAESLSIDFSSLRRDGSVVQLGMHVAAASYHGRPARIAVLQDISEKKRDARRIAEYLQKLKAAFESTVEVVSKIGEIRDPYTHGHERRVGEIAAAIAAEMGMDADRVEGIRVAGHMHDVGKISVPAEILSKPTRLSPTEFDMVRAHAQQGYDILKGIDFPWPVALVALQHHERLDGSGYPQGLKGDAIALEARIISIADVIEAMSSHRPYRPGLGVEKSLAEIERGRGIAYEPAAVDACLRLFRDKGYAIPA
jgi:PAS domain S-box-containing protein